MAPPRPSLSIKPPDYGNGHLDIHTDGDIFYWIQNGISQGSPMPAVQRQIDRRSNLACGELRAAVA